LSLKQFPQDLYALILETSTPLFVGGVSVGNDLELGHVRLHVYIQGTIATTTDLTLTLYSDSGFNDAYATSSTLTFDSIENYGTGWMGTLRFDFDKEHLLSGETYYAKVSSSNYTRNGDVDYVGFVCDWPITINSLSSAAKMEVIGYE